MSKLKSLFKKGGRAVNNRVKSMDMFGAPVSLNFRGESTYNTTIGGVISLFTIAFTLFYAYTEAMLVYSKLFVTF